MKKNQPKSIRSVSRRNPTNKKHEIVYISQIPSYNWITLKIYAHNTASLTESR